MFRFILNGCTDMVYLVCAVFLPATERNQRIDTEMLNIQDGMFRPENSSLGETSSALEFCTKNDNDNAHMSFFCITHDAH